MKRKYLILFSLSGFVLCLDQLTKNIVFSRFSKGVLVPWIPGFLNFHHTQNSGFAFGIFKATPDSLKDVFFVGVPAFALVLIVLIFIKLRDDQMPTSLALTCILGGAVGNLIDRLHFGFVIDFLDFHIADKVHFPPFNVADLSIMTGVTLMLIQAFHRETSRNQEEVK